MYIAYLYEIIRITYIFTYINHRKNSYTSIDRDDRCRADKRSPIAASIEPRERWIVAPRAISVLRSPFHRAICLLSIVAFVFPCRLRSSHICCNSMSTIWKNSHCLLYCPCHFMLSFYRSTDSSLWSAFVILFQFSFALACGHRASYRPQNTPKNKLFNCNKTNCIMHTVRLPLWSNKYTSNMRVHFDVFEICFSSGRKSNKSSTLSRNSLDVKDLLGQYQRMIPIDSHRRRVKIFHLFLLL